MGTTERAEVQPDLPVQVGATIAGKFRIERIIGEGGVGYVVEATHIKLDEPVAIKFLRQASLSNPDIVRRFAREARAAVKMKGEHAARVIDVGELPDGTPFIVMEFLKGSDLASTLSQRGRFEDAGEAVEYIIQACEALAEAHSLGIVHRDIKPENLFLVRRAGSMWQLKLLDFGISKAALTGEISNVDLDSNHTTTIMGSPFYMSPEQIRSTRDVDGRADIWSVGAVLFELLTGQTPWEQDNLTGLVASILEDPPRSLSKLRPDLPPGLEDVIRKCLDKDRAKRYQNAAELAVALFPFAPKRVRAHVERASEFVGLMEGRLLESTRPPPHSSQTSLVTGATTSPALSLPGPPGVPKDSMTSMAEELRGPQRRSATLLLVGLAAGAVIAGAAFFVARGTSAPPPATGAPAATVAPPPTVALTGAAPADTGNPLPTTAAGTATGSASAADSRRGSTTLGAVPPPQPRGNPPPSFRPGTFQPARPSAPASPPVAAAPVPPTPATPAAPAAAPEPPKSGTSMDTDPWKRNPHKPKMDENPFAK